MTTAEHPCPECGTVRQAKSSDQLCGACSGGKRMRLTADEIAWAVAHAQQARAVSYAQTRAAKHPWLSLPEAAFELGISESRVSQLISKGTFAARKHPEGGKCKQVKASDVYAYVTCPTKKRTTTK